MIFSRPADRLAEAAAEGRRTAPALEVRGVSKTFGRGDEAVDALDAVSLHAAAGEFVSIVGPSGCGKSTLLNLVAGLDLPNAGEVLLNGESILGQTGKLGYMPQRDLLLPWRSVLGNVTLAAELQGGDLKAARREATGMLPLFGLEGFARRYPYELSGGMRQRAALLRTVLAGRDVLLLDEPFGALDALTRLEMQQWLLGIWERFGKTIVFITHDVDEAIYLAGRVYVMSPRPGRMVAEVKVDLPAPRSPEATATPRFEEHKLEILRSLGVIGKSKENERGR